LGSNCQPSDGQQLELLILLRQQHDLLGIAQQMLGDFEHTGGPSSDPEKKQVYARLLTSLNYVTTNFLNSDNFEQALVRFNLLAPD